MKSAQTEDIELRQAARKKALEELLSDARSAKAHGFKSRHGLLEAEATPEEASGTEETEQEAESDDLLKDLDPEILEQIRAASRE